MLIKSMWLGPLIYACCLSVCPLVWMYGDEPPIEIIRQQYQGRQLEIFKNSPTVSEVLGMNSASAVFGMKEAAGSFKHLYFYCDQDQCQDLPIPEGFTSLHVSAISDDHKLVGRAMKAVGSEGSIRATVWTPKLNQHLLLPIPDGDSLTDAFDISADGQRITGYATGPDRLRPVVWQWDQSQSVWNVTVLPTVHDNNPYLMSAQLVISPDGQTIVGCCTENFLPNGSIDSSLYHWREMDNVWQRRRVTEEQMYIKAINNRGHMAGSVPGSHGRLPCLIKLDGQVQLLDLLPGDVAGEARDINEQSIIAGWSDDPRSAEGGPKPCLWTSPANASPKDEQTWRVTQVRLNEQEIGMLSAINNHGQLAGTLAIVPSSAKGEAESAMLAVRASPLKGD